MSSKWEALAREIPANHEVKIGPAESAPDGSVRRLKDLTLFFFGLLVLVTVVAYSLVVLLTDGIAEEDRRWATSTLTAVFGGALGWLVKR